MLKNIFKFEGVNVLSKSQLKTITGGLINGGGSCCGRSFYSCGVDGDHLCSSVSCDLTKGDAIGLASGTEGGNWCCSSCGSASWT